METEALNEFVPLETRFRHLLIENGSLKAYICELEDQLREKQAEVDCEIVTKNNKLKATIRNLETVLHDKNLKLNELSLRLLKYDEQSSYKGDDPIFLTKLLGHLSIKYDFDLINEKKEYYK